MGPRLAWVPDLTGCLQRASWGQIRTITIRKTVDPLKMHLVFNLGEPFAGEDFNHTERLTWAFAKANDCVLEKMKRTGPLEYTAVVLTKRRLGPPMRNNPFLRDKGSNPPRGG